MNNPIDVGAKIYWWQYSEDDPMPTIQELQF